MHGPPPITPELVARLEAVQTAHMVSRLGCIAEAPGNPGNLTTTRFGRATAFRMTGAPDWDFPNYCDGADPAELDAIVVHYREAGISPRIELSPIELTPELGFALHQHGFYQSRFHAVLYGKAVAPPPDSSPPGVSIQEVENASDLEAFLDVTLAAFGLRPGTAEGAKVNQRRWSNRPGWTLLLAKIDGQPAAGAVLYIHDQVAYLAYGGTAPEYRRRGCQSALIAARLARAADAGCQLISGCAYFGSTSQRNQQRAGLQLAYLQSIWMSGPPKTKSS